MKTIVRCFVVALAVTGFAATATTYSASTKATVSAATTSAMPAPRCPLNDPNGCGMNNW